MEPLRDLTGEVIADKYELVRLIGSGGMGAVYEARQSSTRKRCAVKVLLTPELSGDAEVVKRFFREARAGGLIESDHVVAAFDSGIDAKSRVYYVMECLQGEDLSQALQRLGSLNPSVATKILLQVATGLASAHALGIIHRDLKPANLFLALSADDQIRVKILDFGVAKVKMEIFDESSDSLTSRGGLLGTPRYMSPEQVKRASTIDESADVWSLGVVLFECLTGELPWEAVDSVGELIAAILTAEIPSVQDRAPWVSPELAAIVQQALARDTKHRFRSAADLRAALKALEPGDLAIYRHELVAPTEQERSLPAQRLEFSDTVNVLVGSGAPDQPRQRSRALVALALAASAIAAIWSLQPKDTPGGQGANAVAIQPPPDPVVASSASSPGALRFMVEIEPPSAQVTVSGVAIEVSGGRALVEGAVNSTHLVRLTQGDQSSEQRVALTLDGPIPARLALPAKPSPVAPAAERPKARTAEIRPTPAPSPPTPELGPAASAAVPTGLSQKFE